MKSRETAMAVDVDEYVNSFPAKLKAILQKLRKTIRAAAPEAEELISYKMPAYKYNGMLVYFAGFKNHIGLYPAPGGIEAFNEELAKYKSGKGSIRFPLDEPIPFELVSKIVKYRMIENSKKTAGKKRSKPPETLRKNE